MNTNDERLLRILQDALQGLSDCTLVMQENAVYVERELPNVRMSDGNLAQTRALCRDLIAARGDVHRILSELDGAMIATAEDRRVLVETAYRALSRIQESRLRMNDAVRALETRDEKDAGLVAAYILVAESAANILRTYHQAKVACDAMQEAVRAWPKDGAPTGGRTVRLAESPSAGGDG